MIIRPTVSIFTRNQKCLKLLLATQRKLDVCTTALLHYEDIQGNAVAATPSTFAFDTTLVKTPQKNTDLLGTKLSKAQTEDELLQLVAAHSSIMNNRHISTTFSFYHNFIKDKSRKELSDKIHDQGLLQLCKRTVQIAHHFTPDEAITIFKTLGFLNVPSTAKIMQVLCQIIRRNINSLSLSQIVFLIFLLKKQQSTPLVEALLIALPLVLQSQLDLQMDPENLDEMVYCLEVATTRKLGDAAIQKLSNAIALQADKLTTFHARTIVASTVPECQFPDTFEQIIFKSFDILTHDINNITDKEAMMLLSKMRTTNIFNKPFITALIDKAIERKWDLIKLGQLLSVCERHEFISEDLLHYTMCEMQQHVTELNNDNRISLINIIGSFALIGYKSALSKEVWTSVINCEKKFRVLQEKSPMLFFKLNSELSLLGCCPLSSVFTDDVLSSVLENIKKGRMKFAQELCIIEWATKIVNTNFTGSQLPKHVFEEAINRIWEERQKRNFFLEPFLKIALGGTQFFETNLITKYGHAIDHVVMLRKGDYPMAIEQTQDSVTTQNTEAIRFVEDLAAPPEAKILVIIAADKSCYCKNSLQLKGWMKLQLDSLSKLGYLPFLINSESWSGLLSHEKIPYLMREMKVVLKQSELEDTVNAYPAM